MFFFGIIVKNRKSKVNGYLLNYFYLIINLLINGYLLFYILGEKIKF